MTCRYAIDTGRPWCNCPVKCTEVECRNPERLAALLPNGARRSDGAAFHSKYATEDRASATFVLVRSKYCCEKHCVDFKER